LTRTSDKIKTWCTLALRGATWKGKKGVKKKIDKKKPKKKFPDRKWALGFGMKIPLVFLFFNRRIKKNTRKKNKYKTTYPPQIGHSRYKRRTSDWAPSSYKCPSTETIPLTGHSEKKKKIEQISE
jgi:hypothetical protein